MASSKPFHVRSTAWAIAGIEIGALLFVIGLAALYLNPFWHFDQGGFLDWRVHWWNAMGETLVGAGLVVEVLALVFLVAVLVSRLAHHKPWPYMAAAVLVVGVVAWVGTESLLGSLNAHFEWNAADGFTVFRLQPLGAPSETLSDPQNALWKSIVEIQIQPLLRGYFRLNDWQKMNGDIAVRVMRIIPVAWPIALGSGADTFQDPDETALMQAAEKQDVTELTQLLSASTKTDINALDQEGQTALIFACKNPKASPEVVKALLAAGADVNLRARNGYAPLTWALARKNAEVVRILRQAGAKP